MTHVNDLTDLSPCRFPSPSWALSATVYRFETQPSPYPYELERDVQILNGVLCNDWLIGVDGPANSLKE